MYCQKTPPSVHCSSKHWDIFRTIISCDNPLYSSLSTLNLIRRNNFELTFNIFKSTFSDEDTVDYVYSVSSLHCKENLIYVLRGKKLRSLSPSFRDRFIYSHDRSACSAAGKYVDWSWEYINRSQKDECRMWDWGRAVSFLGISVSIFRYTVCLCSVRGLRVKREEEN